MTSLKDNITKITYPILLELNVLKQHLAISLCSISLVSNR